MFAPHFLNPVDDLVWVKGSRTAIAEGKEPGILKGLLVIECVFPIIITV